MLGEGCVRVGSGCVLRCDGCVVLRKLGTLRTAVSIALLAAGHGHVPAIPPEVYGSRCERVLLRRMEGAPSRVWGRARCGLTAMWLVQRCVLLPLDAYSSRWMRMRTTPARYVCGWANYPAGVRGRVVLHNGGYFCTIGEFCFAFGIGSLIPTSISLC